MSRDLDHFQDISQLYNKRGGEDPKGTNLTCYSMHLIITIKNIYWFMVGDLEYFLDYH